jgi:hypothetical protein
MFRSNIYLLSLSLLAGQHIQAAPLDNLHGFAQQTLLTSDNNDFVGNSDDNIISDIRDFGLNYRHSINPAIGFAGQIVSHQAGAQTDNNIELDYGFIEYSPLHTDTLRASMRVGRVIQNFGLFNEVRDVAHLRTSIFVPYSIYYDRLRKTVFAEDGASFKLDIIGHHMLSAEVGIAKPRADNKEIQAFLPSRYISGKAEGNHAYFFRLSHEQALDYRIALSGIYLNWDFNGDFNIPIDQNTSIPVPINGSLTASSIGISIEKYLGNFTLISEVFRPQIEYLDLIPTLDTFGQVVGKQKIRSQQLGGYLHLSYTCTANITCFTQYEYFKVLSKQAELSNTTTRDTSVGLQVLLPHDLQFKFEIHAVSGSAWLGLDQSLTHNDWHYIASQINWKF